MQWILTLTILLISSPVVTNQADLTLRQDAPQNFYATFVRDGRRTINTFLNPTLLEAKNKPTQQTPAQDRVHKKAFLLGYLSSFYLHPIFSGKKSGSESTAGPKKEESTTTAATTTTTASTTTTTPKPYKHKDTKYVYDYDEEDYDDDEYYHECYHEDHKYRRYKK